MFTGEGLEGPCSRKQRRQIDNSNRIPQIRLIRSVAKHRIFIGDSRKRKRRDRSFGRELLKQTVHQGLFEEFAPKRDRKSTRLNSSHVRISYAVFCLKKKNRSAT